MIGTPYNPYVKGSLESSLLKQQQPHMYTHFHFVLILTAYFSHVTGSQKTSAFNAGKFLF